MKKSLILPSTWVISAIILTVLSGCSKSESYSDMLRSEEKAVNWYLSNHRVSNDIPEDGEFEVGENAPYYKMDEDGYVYMQVLSIGNRDDKVKEGEKVYFLYTRFNIRNYWELGSYQTDSNEQGGNLGDYYFFFGDTSTGNGAFYGEGLQLPLKYLPYHSEVNLVLKSNKGFKVDMSECIPYAVQVKYLKPEY